MFAETYAGSNPDFALELTVPSNSHATVADPRVDVGEVGGDVVFDGLIDVPGTELGP